MARASSDSSPRSKEPGRIAQMWQVFQMTRRNDRALIPWLLLVVLGPIVLGVLAALFTPGNVITMILWIVVGVLLGVLLGLLVLGRRAERAAYSQIEGQPGATGAVIKSSLRRSWRGDEMPVAVNPRTQDAVYRVTGRGGIVLIGEGPKSRTQRMLADESRRLTRTFQNVPITLLYVGPDPDSTPLYKVPRELTKIKSSLTKAEVQAITNRLHSLAGTPIGIPKGVDPLKVRPQRMR